VDESATEWHKPEKSQKDGETSNNLGIDEAGFGSVTVAHITDAVKISAGNTSHDSCKSKLKNSQYLLQKGWLVDITYFANAENQAQDIIYGMHLGGVFLNGLTVCWIFNGFWR